MRRLGRNALGLALLLTSCGIWGNSTCQPTVFLSVMQRMDQILSQASSSPDAEGASHPSVHQRPGL